MNNRLAELCKTIHMPDEVIKAVYAIAVHASYESCHLQEIHCAAVKLMKRNTWNEGLGELKCLLGEDPDGFKMLTVMLLTGLSARENYRSAGISDEIFYDTFGCFSRFVNEHKISYGRYGFDRERWTPRQLAMEEFRIGTLEYETNTVDGKPVISIHIPSDARLSRENCRKSYLEARDFFSRYFPDYRYECFRCDSWLLSPNLPRLLESDSRILVFQSGFVIDGFRPEVLDYMEWVFKNPSLSIDEVPQETFLQRKMKAYIKNGGDIGCGRGYVKEDAWADIQQYQ